MGAAYSLTIIPNKTPIIPILEKILKKTIICVCVKPDLIKATSKAMDSAGWCKEMEMVNRAQSRKVSANPNAIISKTEWTPRAANNIRALRPVASDDDDGGGGEVLLLVVVVGGGDNTDDDTAEPPFISNVGGGGGGGLIFVLLVLLSSSSSSVVVVWWWECDAGGVGV